MQYFYCCLLIHVGAACGNTTTCTAVIDVEGMRHDIPKHYVFMTPSAVEHWKDRLENLENWFLHVPEDPEWPLDILNQFSRPPAVPNPDDGNVVALESLREREVAPTPEVRKHKLKLFLVHHLLFSIGVALICLLF